ncbi:hypothetical protein DPMN_108946 [Dreissena polymorpha]|uniref:Uncharacterized protein n=1 Tax=Dreissena polymorpha TaxID=45954 RepID=A0A9D4QMH8_DREPO|nr:hypothetical protein DPMN_108946 [Dreissena polymorpha]
MQDLTTYGAESLNADIEPSVKLIYPLFSKIWKKKKIQLSAMGYSSSSSPKKATSFTAATTKESRFCPPQ